MKALGVMYADPSICPGEPSVTGSCCSERRVSARKKRTCDEPD
jgi:hypothetical protein